MYSMHFTHIVYCGGKITKFLRTANRLKVPVTFVETDVKRGAMRQKCLIKAMEMNYGVDGYLLVSDDTLLNPWTFVSLPVNKFWFIKPVTFNHNSSSNNHKVWHKLQSRNTERALHKSLKELERANQTLYMDFRKHLWENTNFNYDGYLTMATDAVYTPRHYQHHLLLYLNIFTRNGMFHDHAIPTAIAGVVNLKEVHYLDGHYDDRGNGRSFHKYFHKNFNFLHPMDLQNVMKTADGVDFICSTFLPFVFGG